MINSLGILYIIVKFIIGIFYGLVAIYTSIWTFDALTKKIEEWKEMKDGNIAVAIYMAAVVFTLAMIVEGGIRTTLAGLSSFSLTELTVLAVFDFIKLLIVTFLGVGAIYVTLTLMDKITKDIDEYEEINRGNIAVAILVAVILISIGFVIRTTVYDIAQNFNIVDVVLSIQ